MATDADAGIYARHAPFLDRYVQIGLAQGKVLSVSFPDAPAEEATVDGEHPLLDRIDGYLDGQPTDFDDIDVALTVPTDHRAVLEAVRSVPYGEGVSTEQLASMTAGLDADDEDAFRTVRTALAENPAPLIIPDHRVHDGPSAAPPAVEQKLRSIEGL
jgi:methylated-DNA-[protein]-cysteine S-methyltransferase